MPFGEYVPLRSLLEALGAPVDQIGRDAVAGTGPAVIELPDGTRARRSSSRGRCSSAAEHARASSSAAEAILNPTNGSSYTGTIVQTQQVASSRLRAVENGRWVVQAAPTGFTAVIDAGGDVLAAHLDQRADESCTPTSSCAPDARGTPNLGDGPIIAALIVVLLVSMWFGGRFDRIRHRRTA